MKTKVASPIKARLKELLRDNTGDWASETTIDSMTTDVYEYIEDLIADYKSVNYARTNNPKATRGQKDI